MPDDPYIRAVVQHAKTYAEANVHMNGIENLWRLLNRCIGGTYVAVEPFPVPLR